MAAADKEKTAKLKALQLTLDKLDKTYGKGSVMKLGCSNRRCRCDFIWFFRFRFSFRCWWLSKR